MTTCKSLNLLLLITILLSGCSASHRTNRTPSVHNIPPGEKILADARIAEIWRLEGQHALLHHLNAIFGYKPLTIRKNLTF